MRRQLVGTISKFADMAVNAQPSLTTFVFFFKVIAVPRGGSHDVVVLRVTHWQRNVSCAHRAQSHPGAYYLSGLLPLLGSMFFKDTA